MCISVSRESTTRAPSSFRSGIQLLSKGHDDSNAMAIVETINASDNLLLNFHVERRNGTSSRHVRAEISLPERKGESLGRKEMFYSLLSSADVEFTPRVCDCMSKFNTQATGTGMMNEILGNQITFPSSFPPRRPRRLYKPSKHIVAHVERVPKIYLLFFPLHSPSRPLASCLIVYKIHREHLHPWERLERRIELNLSFFIHAKVFYDADDGGTASAI